MTIPYASTALDLMMNLLPHIHALVVEVRVHDKNLADELFRAAKSVALNHSEADGVRKGHRKERIGTAAGSCAEAITAVRMARSVSPMASISPKCTPRDRVVAAPITRNPDCPASDPMPSVSRLRSVPSNLSTRQAILELPTSRIAITPLCIATLRMLRMARWDSYSSIIPFCSLPRST